MFLRWLGVVVFALGLSLTVCGPARAGDVAALEGKYEIKGWDPGNSPVGEPDYEGSAILARWGDTLRYHGFMDEMTYAGAAIYDSECHTLSLSFTNGDGSERGVTHLRVRGDGSFEGAWAMDNGGDGKLGHEIWTRK